MMFIDGRRRHLRGYAGTPLEELIPVEWVEAPAREPVEPRLTRDEASERIRRLFRRGSAPPADELPAGAPPADEAPPAPKPTSRDEREDQENTDAGSDVTESLLEAKRRARRRFGGPND